MTDGATAGLAERYRAYLDTVNRYAWDELGAFVREDVRLNDEPIGRVAYVARVAAVVDAFDDYRWVIEQLVVDGPHLAARLTDTGTHTGRWLGVEPTGRRVRALELAYYRFDAGLIAEVWSTANDLDVLRQLGAVSP